MTLKHCGITVMGAWALDSPPIPPAPCPRDPRVPDCFRILVSEVPVTLGDGVPLFSAQDLSRLKEVSSRKLEGGMRQVTYTARARPEHE